MNALTRQSLSLQLPAQEYLRTCEKRGHPVRLQPSASSSQTKQPQTIRTGSWLQFLVCCRNLKMLSHATFFGCNQLWGWRVVSRELHTMRAEKYLWCFVLPSYSFQPFDCSSAAVTHDWISQHMTQSQRGSQCMVDPFICLLIQSTRLNILVSSEFQTGLSKFDYSRP